MPGLLSIFRPRTFVGGDLELVASVGVLDLTAGSHTFMEALVASPGILRLRAGTHEISGVDEPTLVLLEGTGPRRKDHPWTPPHFVQVAFERLRTTTQSIRDVIKGD